MATLTQLSGRALANLLPDLGNGPKPLYSGLSSAVTSLLLDGRIAPGTRLPSERDLASSLGLSRATVTAAYDTLRSEGILVSRTGSGSVIELPAQTGWGSGHGRMPVLPARSFDNQRSSSPRWGEDVNLIDLSCATLPAPPELGAAVGRASAALTEHLGGSGYEPRGLEPLREAIAARFTARGAPTTADQILVTNGALHGIDLVLRMLIGPGDRVLTELPTYSGILDAVRASGARPVAVPIAPGGEGWQLGPMLAALRQSAPRLAMLIPDFHNPTGFLAPEADRRELLRAARRAGTTVLVDESFIDFGFCAPETPTAALDPSVITVGSLSKAVWGGLRVGWIRASADVIARLVVVRASIDMGQSILEQLVALEMFPLLETITAQRRAEVLPQRDFLLDTLAERFPQWRVPRPLGGLCLWVELDAPLATPFAMRAAQYGVRIVAGSRFGIDGTMERFLRLPYALPVADLGRAVERLWSAWHDLDATVASGYSPLIVA